jgi:hypothetical protein
MQKRCKSSYKDYIIFADLKRIGNYQNILETFPTIKVSEAIQMFWYFYYIILMYLIFAFHVSEDDHMVGWNM